jgi:hypothetical protein
MQVPIRGTIIGCRSLEALDAFAHGVMPNKYWTSCAFLPYIWIYLMMFIHLFIHLSQAPLP